MKLLAQSGLDVIHWFNVLFLFSWGKHFLSLRRLSMPCVLSLLSTSLLRRIRTTFRRFSLKILWEWKYWGNCRIQFSWAKTSVEMNWTYSDVPRNILTVQAAIHCIRRYRSYIPAAQYLFALSWGNGKKSNISQFWYFSTFFCFWVLFVQLKAQQWCFTISRALVDVFISSPS